ncbi:hypothetical protein ACG94X_14115 [Acinetobacter sp. ULE_I010]|uniref:hypothetical protein n=1 Tax=Acinetobacter sp. ULE_I010 TaxID=3373065 RepID=UPI003AF8334F
MENIEQPAEDTTLPNTAIESEQVADQSQGDGDSEVELTAEQQAEATQKAETEKATQRQNAIDKRINKLTWERNEAFRKAEALEAKYGAVNQANLKEPQLHEYESVEDFAKAVVQYQKTAAERGMENHFEQQRNEQMYQAQVIKLDTAEAAFTKDHADYHHVIDGLVNLSGGQFPEQISIAVLDLGEDAPAVLYQIGKDPADFIDLLNMSPLQQMMKLGEVRASLKNAPKLPKISNAPPPVNPPKGGANSKKDPYKGSDDEFLRSRGIT